MKKTLFALVALAATSAYAADVTDDQYIFSNNKFIALGDDICNTSGSFGISYELQDLTLNDVITAGGTLFELNINTANFNLTYNSGTFTAIVTPGWNYTTSSFVPYIDKEVTFLFQYDADANTCTFSYYNEYDSPVNPHDLTTLISIELADGTPFESEITSGSFKINVPQEGSVSNIHTWTGKTTADDIAATKTVPEPATATLSLLALAGLAARRRRR